MNYKILTKFIKNLFFNIENQKEFTQLSKNIRNYKINLDIKSKQVEKKIIEIEISLYLEEKKTGKILTKLIYSTVIELINLEIRRELLEKIILIEIPEKVYEAKNRLRLQAFRLRSRKHLKSRNIAIIKILLAYSGHPQENDGTTIRRYRGWNKYCGFVSLKKKNHDFKKYTATSKIVIHSDT